MSELSTLCDLPSTRVTRRSTTGCPLRTPRSIWAITPFSTLGMNWRGTAPPTTLSTNSKPDAGRQRLDLDVADGVLAVAAGLLDVPAVAPAGAGERLAQRDHQLAGLDVDAVAPAQPVEGHLGVRLAEHPQHDLLGLGVALDPQARVLRGQPGQRRGELVLVGAGAPPRSRPGAGGPASTTASSTRGASGLRQGVAGLGGGQPAHAADVAGDQRRGGHQVLAEGVGEHPRPLVVVVVLVPGALAEERGEVAGDVQRQVGAQGAGEDADDADPADVRVARRLHDLGHQRARRGRRSAVPAALPIGRYTSGDGCSLRRREAGHHQVEQLGAADAGGRAHRDHRVEGAGGHRLLEVGDQGVLADLLSPAR